jgi:hypothetical protein
VIRPGSTEWGANGEDVCGEIDFEITGKALYNRTKEFQGRLALPHETQKNILWRCKMRYLVVMLLLLPSLALAGQGEKYSLKCEDISGGQCKKACAESDTKVKQVEIMEGEKKGTIADVDCSANGKGYVCCVEKDKIKK